MDFTNLITRIKNDLKNNLSDFRYEHCLLVADEAKKLAHHYHIDENNAYIAGLVHDIAKEFDDKENAYWIEKYHLSSDLYKPEFKKIIHANIGVVVAKELYSLDDDICNAVCYHTIGNVPMSLLDKIVFISDKIARKNRSPIIEQTASLAYQDIVKAMLFFIENEKSYLESRGESMHPTTLKLLDCLKK